MDTNNNVIEMQHSVDKPSAVPNVEGFFYIQPFNPSTFDRMDWLWDNMKTQEYAFDDFTRGSAKAFVSSMLDTSAIHFLVGDSGYIVIRGLTLSDNPHIHFAIWDKSRKFIDILNAGREVINFLFNKLKVRRITATIPVYNKQAVKFATLLGFKFEGEMRNAVVFFEHHYNVQIYGLLQEEWLRRR